MAAGQMALDVLVRLRDLMSGPLRRLSGTVRGFTNLAGRIGVVGAAIAGISFMAPIAGAAEFQQQLLDMAGTAELTGAAAFKFIDDQKTRFEDLALATGQASDGIASAVANMYAAGLDGALIDGAIDDIAKVSTAANAATADIAAVATSSMMTLGVPADQIEKVLAMLVTSGKLGAFELKDMARYFPSLTSQVAKFGVKGQEAVGFLGAALQIARKGTSDPAEAANNLKNFLSKILAPATVKNFKDMGVDIEAVMQDAATKGINPIEAVLQKVMKLTGVSENQIAEMMAKAKANGLQGAEALDAVREQLVQIAGAGGLGELFQDQQVMDFLIPFMANVDEYKAIRDKMDQADSSVIDADFETQMKGLNRQLKTFREIGTQGIREVGLAFGEWLPQINGYLKAGLDQLRAWNKETDGGVHKALSFAGAGVLLGGALGVIGFVLPPVIAGLRLVLSPLWLTGKGALRLAAYFYRAAAGSIALQSSLAAMNGVKLSWLGRLGVGLRGILFAIPGISWVAGGLISAFSAIGAAAATVTAPVWGLIAAIVAAVAAIGVAVWRYWEPISNFIGGFSEVIWNAVTDMMNALADFAGWVDSQVIDFYGMFGIDVPGIRAQLADARGTVEAWWTSLKSWASGLDLWEGIKSMFTMKDYSDEMETGFRDAGAKAAQAMVDAVKGKVEDLVAWFGGIGARIVDAVGNIDLSSVISWPSWSNRPQWLGGTGGVQPQQMPQQPANNNMEASVDVTVRAESGTSVTSANANSKGKGKATVNTGKAVGMP
ncbi:phage tail tape measure protein [Martelella mediterranea]|uniref:TP901 family phage tail tape measure protein n=1 Tax=Martelella mediterranea TaxID=293089 RepID=A0A4R3NM85_9HYPH|nr:phage tail tape measure protein [Martelella mediterranea]TCT35371.1 TP901 family phage tail tape measure protein [Martelella mediterranea]